MLKIALDATPIRPQPSGIGVFVLNSISALHSLQQAENFQLNLVYQPSLKNWLKFNSSLPAQLQGYSSVRVVPLPVTVANFLGKYPNPVLPYFEKYLGAADIVHGTDYYVYPCRFGRKVMSIYDLTYLKYPDYTPQIVRKTYGDRVQQCLQWTDLILTISESSKRDIVRYLGVSPEKVAIATPASRYSSNTLQQLEAKRVPLGRRSHRWQNSVPYDFSHPYLLFVSTLEPRKNVGSLLQAFNRLKQKHKIPHHLVLIGKKGWNYEPIFAAIENSPWRQHIHHLNYLNDEQVALFYARADLFVYPSYYEGFGLPVLEAMTLGTPVVAAETSSLPEVAGEAALLVDPHRPQELADAIALATRDRQLRQELIDKGKQRATVFSWERTAKEMLGAYRGIIHV